MEDIYGKCAYKAKPASPAEEVVLLVHSLVMKRGFVCTGAHENEAEGNLLIVVPQMWRASAKEGVFAFRYRSGDRKFGLQMKILLVEEGTLDVNLLYDKLPNTVLAAEVRLAQVDGTVIETAVQQVETRLKEGVFSKLGGGEEEKKGTGFNLRPVVLRDEYRGGFGQPIRQDPNYDINPVGMDPFGLGGGGLMGPGHPYFTRDQNRFVRQDPPLGGGLFPPRGPGGMGGFGGFGPMG